MTPYTAVVVAHNQPRQLLAALVALRAHARPTEILVIDNGSSANLSGVIALSQMPARIVRLDEHQSLSTACNVGIDAAGNDIILLIHSDVLLESNPQPLASQLATTLNVGVIGGKLFRPGNEPRRIAQVGYTTSHGRINPQPIGDHKWDTFHEARDVAAVSTACMLIRRTHVRFDERYWFRLEDVDFCHQYAQRGQRTMFAPDLRATHLESGGARERASETGWAERQIASHMLYHERWCSHQHLEAHPRQSADRGDRARAYLATIDAALQQRYPELAATS